MNAAELPEVVSIARNGSEVLIEARVPADLAYLSGHFPGAPVVAGVVQLAWVEHYARQQLSLRGEVCGMEQLKFQRLLRPHDAFTLRVSLGELRQVAFRLHDGGNVFSSGRLLFDA